MVDFLAGSLEFFMSMIILWINTVLFLFSNLYTFNFLLLPYCNGWDECYKIEVLKAGILSFFLIRLHSGWSFIRMMLVSYVRWIKMLHQQHGNCSFMVRCSVEVTPSYILHDVIWSVADWIHKVGFIKLYHLWPHSYLSLGEYIL